MTIERVAIKLYAEHDIGNLTPVIPVFHRWIQETVALDLPLDVADYRHVPSGPGVILIGHEADLGLDRHEGPLGLIYNRKRMLSGDDHSRLVTCLQALRQAATALEAETLGLRFPLNRLRVVFNDRLRQPNTTAGFDSVAPAIETAIAEVFGAGAEPMLERDGADARTRLIVHVGLAGVLHAV